MLMKYKGRLLCKTNLSAKTFAPSPHTQGVYRILSLEWQYTANLVFPFSVFDKMSAYKMSYDSCLCMHIHYRSAFTQQNVQYRYKSSHHLGSNRSIHPSSSSSMATASQYNQLNISWPIITQTRQPSRLLTTLHRYYMT